MKGFTLLELLVYIIISAIVTTIATRVWYDAAIFSGESKRKVNLQGLTQELFHILDKDMQRVGTTMYMDDNNQLTTADQSYIDQAANRSLTFTNSANKDRFEFRTSRIVEGVSVGFEDVTYWVDDGDVLWRSSQFTTTDVDLVDEVLDSVILARNISEFDFKFGVYGRREVAGEVLAYEADISTDNVNLITVNGVNPATYDDEYIVAGDVFRLASITGFVTDTLYNINLNDILTVSDFERGATYRIEFRASFNQDFIDNYNLVNDILSFQFWKVDESVVYDGIDVYNFTPELADGFTKYQFKFHTSDNDLSLAPYFKLRLRNIISGSPEFKISNIQIFKESAGLLNDSWTDDINLDDTQAYEAMNAKTVKISIGITEDFAGETVEHNSSKIIELINNGARI
jgi:prepilin-type N-terminal cleavage/methylation domain-containing protein